MTSMESAMTAYHYHHRRFIHTFCQEGSLRVRTVFLI
jgi:hypothetical protein